MARRAVSDLWKEMGQNARIAAAAVVAVAVLAAYTSLSGPTQDRPADLLNVISTAQQSTDALPPAPNIPLQNPSNRSIGHPTDPLPEAVPMPSAEPDVAASTLARLVSAEDSDPLPALLAAMRIAGIAVYGAQDEIAIAPDAPDQGLYFEGWQLRAMTGLLGRQHVGVPFSAFADSLVAAVPALRGEPVAQLLLDGIAESARAEDPSTRFWARFIVELGKHTRAYQSYDLLDRPDLATVRLNVVQVALITQRVVADVSTRLGGQVAAAVPRRSLFSMPVVYAAEPCVPSRPRPKPKVSKTAFQQLVDKLTTPHRAVDRAVDPSLGNWFDYPNLMLMLSALKVDVEMEGGPPLKRTKTTTPGEPRRIRALLSLDAKTLEWIACARAWLNSKNHDLKWYPRLPGPVPDVPVDYELDGRAIVRIPLSAPPHERGLPDTTTTDDQGIVRLALEGEPQLRNLPDTAKEERKDALTKVTVKVKPTHLLTRSAPTDGIASTDFIHAWVLDQEFTMDVSYPFEVMDWSADSGRWSGTIEFVETILGKDSYTDSRSEISTQETTTTTVNVQVTETVSEQAFGTIVATLNGAIRGRYDSQKTAAGWRLGLCRHNRKMSTSSRSSSHGSASGESTITVTVFEDGTYLIAAGSSMTLPIEGETNGEAEAFGPPPECVVTTKPDAPLTHVPSTRPVSRLLQMSGKIDPKDPNALSGSTTEDVGGGASRTARTTTWNLRRK